MVIVLGLRISCECTECICKVEFPIIHSDELLNLLQHGRLDEKQSELLRSRIDSRVCKECFVGKHYK